MALATYGHVMEELEGAERRPAEDVIHEARSCGVPSEFPQRGAAVAEHARGTRKVPANRQSLGRTRTVDPLLSMEAEEFAGGRSNRCFPPCLSSLAASRSPDTPGACPQDLS